MHVTNPAKIMGQFVLLIEKQKDLTACLGFEQFP